MKALLLSVSALIATPLIAVPLIARSVSPLEEAGTQVLFVQTPHGRIELHEERGICQKQARRAAFVPADGESVGGCWVEKGTMVGVVFLDGDFAAVPVEALEKALPV